MSVVLDILRTYRAPREVLARRMAGSPREDRALAVLMGACALIFVAQWPRLARDTFMDPSIAFDARLAGALFGWLMVMPLVLYALSLVLQGVMRLIGPAVSGFSVRMSLFWALLASSPLWLLTGLMAGFTGDGASASVLGSLALLAFLGFATVGLSTARNSMEAAI